MKNIGTTYPGACRATWTLDVQVPRDSGEFEILSGDCRLTLAVSGATAVLHCTMSVRIPLADIAERRAHANATLPPGMEAGQFKLSCPLTPADLGRTISVAVRALPARFDLFVDGVLVDEEWPWTPLRGSGAVRVCSEHVTRAEYVDRDLSDAEILARVAAPDLQRATALLGEEESTAQYFRPRGHNTTAGDVMLCTHKDELHLFYLFDRRRHGSKWYAGAHQFYHLSSADLRTWTKHPPAVAIDEPWEAIGTGTCVSDGERMLLFYEQHGERFLDARSRRGMWLAISDDGVNFRKHYAHNPDVVQPGVFKTGRAGEWNLASGQKRFSSTDLGTWSCVENDFLPTRLEMSNECPVYFRCGAWNYVLIGRTGFFMAREQIGPFWKKSDAVTNAVEPAWDIYDGLMVPSVAEFNGRLILAGWIGCYAGPGWGGVLVLRELRQRDDGNLYLSWVPELLPDGGPWQPVELSPASHAHVKFNAAELAPSQSQLAVATGVLNVPPSSSFHVKFDVTLEKKCDAFSVVLGDFFDAAPSLELRFEPARRRIQWGVAAQGARAGESRESAAEGENFAISNVDGLEQPFSVELLIKRVPTGTVIDAAFSFGRTMITRRAPMRMKSLALVASGAAAAAAIKNIFVRTIS